MGGSRNSAPLSSIFESWPIVVNNASWRQITQTRNFGHAGVPKSDRGEANPRPCFFTLRTVMGPALFRRRQGHYHLRSTIEMHILPGRGEHAGRAAGSVARQHHARNRGGVGSQRTRCAC